MSRRLNKWTSILNACQTPLLSKVTNYHIHPQSREGIANMDAAVLEFLNSLLFADQDLQEDLNTSLTRQTQSSCWIYQSGSFSYKFENKVNSSTFPKSNSIPYCNTDMIIWLLLCSVLKALSAMRTLMQAWTQMNSQASSTPFPFFLFGNY